MSADLIFRHAWILFVAVTCVQTAIWSARSRRFIILRPELSASYSTLIRGLLFWGNLPWVIMGLGCLAGGLSGFDYLSRTQVGNVYVLAFLASVVVIWILSVYWVFFKGGAEMPAEHPGRPPRLSGRVRRISKKSPGTCSWGNSEVSSL